MNASDKCQSCGHTYGYHDHVGCNYLGVTADGNEKCGCGAFVVPPHGGKPTNPKDRAASNRLDLSLVPFSAVVYMALALTEGDSKYGGFNWRDAGVRYSVYVAAAMRHLAKAFNGEECDPLTQVPHLASAMACIAVVVDSIQQGNIVDDRPPSQDVGQLLQRCESIVSHIHTLYPNGPERHTQKGTKK